MYQVNKVAYEEYPINIYINGHAITLVRIGRHHLEKHSLYMNDSLILELIYMLNEHTFEVDSTTNGIEYFVADIEYGEPPKIYRLIFLIEGEQMEVLGVVNAYRRGRRRRIK